MYGLWTLAHPLRSDRELYMRIGTNTEPDGRRHVSDLHVARGRRALDDSNS